MLIMLEKLIFLLLLATLVHARESYNRRNVTRSQYDASEVSSLMPVEILKLRGYDSEVYYAPTADGYKINLVRVVNPLIKSSGLRLKRPIIFNHGFLECATIWLINSQNVRPTFDVDICPQEPLDLNGTRERVDSVNGPMMLANYGYDVWLMSMRGTEPSQNHTNLSPGQAKFWDYSLDDFALGDVPSVVNFVRQWTGEPKVAYIGHSQATFSIFGLLAARPEYADVIEPVFAVAPVAYMHHTNSIARPLFISSLRSPKTMGPFPRNPKGMRQILRNNCKNKLPVFQFICKMLDAIIGGRGQGALAGFYSHLPFASSQKVVRHFGQVIMKQNFTRYDHGEEENLRRYGTRDAPLYRIDKIRSRSICLISTQTDTLSHPADVKQFKAALKVPLLKHIYIKHNFNHFDLITHTDARHLVFGPILQILEEFERESGLCAELRLESGPNQMAVR